MLSELAQNRVRVDFPATLSCSMLPASVWPRPNPGILWPAVQHRLWQCWDREVEGQEPAIFTFPSGQKLYWFEKTWTAQIAAFFMFTRSSSKRNSRMLINWFWVGASIFKSPLHSSRIVSILMPKKDNSCMEFFYVLQYQKQCLNIKLDRCALKKPGDWRFPLIAEHFGLQMPSVLHLSSLWLLLLMICSVSFA